MPAAMSIPPSLGHRPRPSLSAVLLVFAAAIGLAACAYRPAFSASAESFLQTQQPQPVGELSQGAIVTQSFWASRNGLTRVTLMLATYARADRGTVTFTLSDEDGHVVHRERFDAASVGDNQPRSFIFSAQTDSAQRGYTVSLQGDSPVGFGLTAWSDRVDRYPGVLRMKSVPTQGDLAMEWEYRTTFGLLLGHLAQLLRRHGPRLLVATALWTLPGLCLLLWLRRGDAEPWTLQRLWATAMALSGTLLVVLPHLAWIARVPLGPWAVWALLVGCGVVLLASFGRGRARLEAGSHPFGPVIAPARVTLTYAGVLALLLLTRFAALHSISAPLWGDSVHHTLITQLLVERGGIVDSYLPYVPLASFTYHSGFHLLSAWVAWSDLPWSDALPAATAVLLNGQLLNVWSVVAVGLLAEGLSATRSEPRHAAWAAPCALLVAGLLSPMPAFYVNWGRYTQLAAQIFLAPGLLWTIDAWTPGRNARHLVPLALSVAALALTHYGLALMYAAAVPVAVAVMYVRHRGERRQFLRKVMISAVAVGVGAGTLIFRWYSELSRGLLVRLLRSIVTGPAYPAFGLADFAFGDITGYVPLWMWALAGLSVIWLVGRRHFVGPLIAAWVLAVFVLANPYRILRLPGTGLLDNMTVQIGLYVPFGALMAIAVVDLADWLAARSSSRMRARLAALVVVGAIPVAVAGAMRRTDIADPRAFGMLTRFDERAGAWIQQHTDARAVFHVNGFSAYGASFVAGSDGGWWLWLVARRATTVPPAVYSMESAFTPTYRADVTERFIDMSRTLGDGSALARQMRARGVEYVYVGAQAGRVGTPPGRARLDPWLLGGSPDFEVVYTDDFVWVFRLTTPKSAA